MKYENFINEVKYKTSNENMKMLIDNLIKVFEKKCDKKFYPSWRGNEGNTKVFVLKLEQKLLSKYDKNRENIITVRLRVDQLDIEVFNGLYCNGKEFPYTINTINTMDDRLTTLFKDINNLFISKIINE